MNVGGSVEEVISRAQAEKKMKRAGYEYGTPAYKQEWRSCYPRGEDGLLRERREPRPLKPKPAATSSSDGVEYRGWPSL